MEETPKKIVENNCFLCSFPLIRLVQQAVLHFVLRKLKLICDPFRRRSRETLRKEQIERNGYFEIPPKRMRTSRTLTCRSNLPTAFIQVQQRSAAKSLKIEQFSTTCTSSNAENDRTVDESYDILRGSIVSGSTYNVAREN